MYVLKSRVGRGLLTNGIAPYTVEEMLSAAQFVFEDNLDEAERIVAGGCSPYHLVRSLSLSNLILYRSTIVKPTEDNDLIPTAREWSHDHIEGIPGV